MNKTFKGLLADGTQKRIRLSTNNGLTGYKIHKLLVIPETPGAATIEAVMKVTTQKQIDTTATPINGVINFDDPRLIGAIYYGDSQSAGDNQATTVLVDNVKFNQDIFISYKEISTTGGKCNFYLELEQVKLDTNEATVATLKDMRGRE
tara:strand:+ start:64 stop:510 length:447 start_codon:yes stop_codon:yes gene_type:complete